MRDRHLHERILGIRLHGERGPDRLSGRGARDHHERVRRVGGDAEVREPLEAERPLAREVRGRDPQLALRTQYDVRSVGEPELPPLAAVRGVLVDRGRGGVRVRPPRPEPRRDHERRRDPHAHLAARARPLERVKHRARRARGERHDGRPGAGVVVQTAPHAIPHGVHRPGVVQLAERAHHPADAADHARVGGIVGAPRLEPRGLGRREIIAAVPGEERPRGSVIHGSIRGIIGPALTGRALRNP